LLLVLPFTTGLPLLATATVLVSAVLSGALLVVTASMVLVANAAIAA